MICPRCFGTGWCFKTTTHVEWAGFGAGTCDYPGCHGGSVDCCDGLQEQPNEERSDKGLEAKPGPLPD